MTMVSTPSPAPVAWYLAPPQESAGTSQHGIAGAPAHHGELLQGVFAVDGELRRALVSLAHPGAGTVATFRPQSSPGLSVTDASLTKVRRAAELTMDELRALPTAPAGGVVEIVSNVPRGVGMGSSTADVVATIRAVADYHGAELPPHTVARLAVAAERASDSIMFADQVVLFAHRAGRLLETLGTALPPLIVLGCNTGADGVDTLEHPPAEYDEREVATFGVLRAALRRAVATGDCRLLGRVATASARLNQRFLPKPQLEVLIELCLRHGGSGVQVAHSGTVAGLMFDARSPDVQNAVHASTVELERLGLQVTTVLRTTTDAVRPAVRAR
ncbi:kinase [Pilimelia terevasa]|uniref:Kinase n=1 Tax=Pilimelia terevasa TaxID=53372 RepID=A0A8J3BN12_9ACTN|nr:hypothetical protein [Pilimelia terevasa]GGK22731.1 kinase [Pilimelia terevasa]